MSATPPTLHPPLAAYAGPTPQQVDLSHLNTLAICHWVWGGVVLLLSSLSIIHVAMGIAMLNDVFPGESHAAAHDTPPNWMGWIMIAAGGVTLLLGWTGGLLTIWSGFCLKKQRRRMLSMIVAGINCLSVPFGTALGVFTFIVLLRESVKRLYAEQGRP